MEMVQTIESLIKEGVVSEEKAPQFSKFYEDAKTGVIDFSYIKKDGSVRFARGTLNPELALKEGGITEDELFDLEEQFNLKKLKTDEINLFPSPTSKKHLHYIDVTAGGVRQLNPNTLIYQ